MLNRKCVTVCAFKKSLEFIHKAHYFHLRLVNLIPLCVDTQSTESTFKLFVQYQYHIKTKGKNNVMRVLLLICLIWSEGTVVRIRT